MKTLFLEYYFKSKAFLRLEYVRQYIELVLLSSINKNDKILFFVQDNSETVRYYIVNSIIQTKISYIHFNHIIL